MAAVPEAQACAFLTPRVAAKRSSRVLVNDPFVLVRVPEWIHWASNSSSGKPKSRPVMSWSEGNVTTDFGARAILVIYSPLMRVNERVRGLKLDVSIGHRSGHELVAVEQVAHLPEASQVFQVTYHGPCDFHFRVAEDANLERSREFPDAASLEIE